MMKMEQKKYIIPCVEILSYQVQNLMKVGSDLPDDPGSTTPAPERRTEVF